MSDKRRIAVPDGMLKAGLAARNAAFMGDEGRVRDILEAALLWLSENPIVPTHDQAIALCVTFEDKGGSRKPDYCDSIRQVAVEWQRRMFLAPEPEVPVADLIAKHFGANPADWVKQLAADCYRRSKESQ